MKLILVSAILILVAPQVHSNPQSLSLKEVTKQLHTATQTGQAKLRWDAPTLNNDGTVLTDLTGYKLYFGQASKKYNSVIDVGNSTPFTLLGLTAEETYFFAVRAYNLSGKENDISNELILRVK